MKTIYYYLPNSAAYVRIRLQKDGGQKITSLVKVDQIAEIVKNNPDAKIHVSYAAHAGGQTARHVQEVTAICIDLDAYHYATEEQIALLRERFRAAAIVHADGVTLIYKLGDGTHWPDLVPRAVAIGRAAEKLTGLTFDWKTLLHKNGTPASHENHLFRFPSGRASRRGRPVVFLPPLGLGSIESD